jgi:hypothetical protein
VLAGADADAERRARWPIDLLRAGLVVALAVVAVAPLVAAGHAWRRRARGGPGTAGLGTLWTLALLALAAIFWVVSNSPVTALATTSGPALLLLAASSLYPMVAFALLPVTARARVRGLRGRMGRFAAVAAAAHAGLAGYLGSWGLVAFRSWIY